MCAGVCSRSSASGSSRKMSQYVLEQLAGCVGRRPSFPVMGGDARTGAPVRRFIPGGRFIGNASGATQSSSVTH
jgi:hypothetical protein